MTPVESLKLIEETMMKFYPLGDYKMNDSIKTLATPHNPARRPAASGDDGADAAVQPDAAPEPPAPTANPTAVLRADSAVFQKPSPLFGMQSGVFGRR
ncbi:MAG: hypothetical protein HY259_10750 [Chloroflexi bacterium]|nr:hypothetical protein [Chloroflexota bacterium]MBI3733917.1 hypothetical protein [Chloroflexota bacterium]